MVDKNLTIEQMKDVMKAAAEDTHANVTASFTLPDGAIFSITYKLPKKKGTK